MILSDREIERLIDDGSLVIEPLSSDSIRENGVDLRLGGEIARFREGALLDLAMGSTDDLYEVVKGDVFHLKPYEHILLATLEYIRLPSDVVGLITLRSSFARAGFILPPTVVDSGYEGVLTIHLRNGPFEVKLYRGVRIIHLILFKSTGSRKLYSGVYKGVRSIKPPIFRESIPGSQASRRASSSS